MLLIHYLYGATAQQLSAKKAKCLAKALNWSKSLKKPYFQEVNP